MLSPRLRNAVRVAQLAPFLERLTNRYHSQEFLGSDPLVLAREFPSPADREIAALFAALLAYGNVRQIQKSLGDLFRRMQGSPGEFVRDFHHAEAAAQLAGFKHRFTDEEDVLCLCSLLHQAIRRNGSLEQAFLRGYIPEEPDLANSAARFVNYLHSLEFAPGFERDQMLAKSSFKHLLPRADRGSACKRIHLFLRWMVRADDGIDLGLWPSLPTSKLLIPLDTHLQRIGTNLGLLTMRGSSLKAARELTAALRALDPDDPTRFDFALCRIGILQACPTRSSLDACDACELYDVCRMRQKLQRATARLRRP